jgi:hypothetical protein
LRIERQLADESYRREDVRYFAAGLLDCLDG